MKIEIVFVWARLVFGLISGLINKYIIDAGLIKIKKERKKLKLFIFSNSISEFVYIYDQTSYG